MSDHHLNTNATGSKGLCTITSKRQPILNLHSIILRHILTEPNDLILQASAIMAPTQEITWAARAFRTVHTAAWRHMVIPVVSKGFFLRCAPRGSAALVCVLKADHMIYVDEVTALVGIEACGGVGFVTAVVEFFAAVTVCEGWWDYTDCYWSYDGEKEGFHAVGVITLV